MHENELTGLTMSPSTNGLVCAVAAYLLWGVLPVYWKALQTVPAGEILGHRIAWSFLLLTGLLFWRKEWTGLRAALRQARTLKMYGLAAALLSLNWFIYIWAVNHGRIVETSLGYFINPLVSVMLGLVVLRESLRRLQWAAVGLALAGVGYLTLQYGGLPWVALVLAFSFGFYGLLKKQAPLGALPGLALETALLALPALGYLAYLEGNQSGTLLRSDWPTRGLLAGAGIVTTVPMLLFARAARAINLSTLGLLQYCSPTVALALGIWVYGEAFPPARLIGFSLIWTALLVYWLDAVLAGVLRRAARQGRPMVKAEC